MTGEVKDRRLRVMSAMTRGVLVLMLCLCAATVFAQNPCEEADQTFRQGEYKEAAKHYKACGIYLNTNTDRKIALCNECLSLKQKADNFFNAGDYANALAQYNALLAKNPSDPVAQQRKQKCSDEINYRRSLAEEEQNRRIALQKEREAEEQRRREEAARNERVRQAVKQEQLKTETRQKAKKDSIETAQREMERQQQREPTYQPQREAETLNDQGRLALAAKSYYRARDYFERSANLGHAAALNNLGYLYELGLGITKNPKEAFSHYLRSAEKGFAAANFNLGRLYEAGIGVKKDLKTARKYYKTAADKGVKEAEERLYQLYE
jgi:TPR repeat protein